MPLWASPYIEKIDMTDGKPDLGGNTQAYENYMGRWSQKVAPLFLQWLDAPKDSSWIDIGCGTVGLTELIARTRNPSSGCSTATFSNTWLPA